MFYRTNCHYSYAEYMNTTNTFSHEGFSARAKESMSLRYGECVGIHYVQGESSVQAFLDSPLHVGTLLNIDYNYCGAAKVGEYECVVFAKY